MGHELEPKSPQTAREAALEGAQADRPPFDRPADQRHLVESAIRLAHANASFAAPGEWASDGVDNPSNELPELDERKKQPMLVGLDGLPTRVSLRTDDADSSVTDNASLGELVRADHTVSRDLEFRDITAEDDPVSGVDERVGPARPARMPPSESAAPVVAEDLQPSSEPWDEVLRMQAPDRLTETPQAAPSSGFSLGDVMGDVGPSTDFPPPILKPPRPGWAWRDEPYYPMHPSVPPDEEVSRPLPLSPADRGGAQFQLDVDDGPAARPWWEEDDPPSFVYRPPAEPSSPSTSDGAPAPVEKLRVEFESAVADVQKNSVLAYLAMEMAMLKAIDEAVEQDRIDAFQRAASRRACL
jgi:hypothetical protein